MRFKLPAICLLSILTLFVFNTNSFCGDEIGEITFILGEAEVCRKATGIWESVTYESKIMHGDIIKIKEESRCEVTMADNSIIRMGENSEFDFSNVEIDAGDVGGSGILSLGTIWTNLEHISAGNKPISVQTPTSLMAVRNTVFKVDLNEDTTTTLQVYQGAVDVKLTEEMEKRLKIDEGRTGPPEQIEGPKEVPGPYEVTLQEWMTIVAGMQINIRKDGKYHSFKFDMDKSIEDEWIRWNLERDALLKR